MDGPALLAAAEAGDTAAVRELLAGGADINEGNSYGDTALMRAAAHGRLAAVRLLLDAGADANAQRGDGMTPLIRAAFFGHAEVVSALLDGGAETGVRDRLGMTALDWARSKGEMEVVSILSGFGTSPADAPTTAHVAPEGEPAPEDVLAPSAESVGGGPEESSTDILDLPDRRAFGTADPDPRAAPRAEADSPLELAAGASVRVAPENSLGAAPAGPPAATPPRAGESRDAHQSRRGVWDVWADDAAGEDLEALEVTRIAVGRGPRLRPRELTREEEEEAPAAVSPEAESERGRESDAPGQPVSWPQIMALSLALMLGSAALTWLVISRLDGAGADTETSTSASQGERAAGESAGAVTAAPPTAAPPENADAVLAGALSDWVAATNSKDIEKQMSFYAPRLAVFYRRRNVSGGAVRREKARLFARAREVRMSASAPEITYGADALTATMRFRKSYTIESGRQTRRGEVVQELVWRKTPDGWKIVGERDVEVIR